MFEPELKCENNTIFNQNYSVKQYITFKMSYSCCFSLGGNPDFPDFLQKKGFITLTTDVGASFDKMLAIIFLLNIKTRYRFLTTCCVSR